jgi:hypothetical protein
MDVQPARIEQVRETDDGDYVIIGADASSAVADLQALDKDLHVRFSNRTKNPYFAVYKETVTADGTTHELVTTVQAYQNSFGVWEGLDQRLVAKMRWMDGHGTSGYNFADELEKSRKRREREQRAAFEERVGDVAEKAAHALRKDLGLGPYKGGIFVPREF